MRYWPRTSCDMTFRVFLPVLALLLALPSRAGTPFTLCNASGSQCAEVTTRGQLFVVFADESKRFACTISGLENTLTQCQAADPTKQYRVSEVLVQGTTVNAASWALQSGTGTNCGTATAALTPGGSTSARWTTSGTGGGVLQLRFQTPLMVTAGHAICAIGQTNNATVVQVIGFW